MKEPLLRETVIDPFVVARMLLEARKADIDPCDYNYILGNIRSRSHQSLSDLFRVKSPAQHGLRQAAILSQIQALFKKNASFGLESERKDKTLRDFHRWESHCRIINRRLSFYDLHPERLTEDLRMKVKKMRSIVAEVLGSFPSYLDSIPERIRFTSGATASTPKALSSPQRKLPKKRGWCYAGSRLAVCTLGRYYGLDLDPKTTNFNVLTQVPKQWDKNRMIAAEAEWSLPFQLTVDSYLKDRLRLVGIDLSDQTANQRLCRQGSLDGSIATIDLSAASDTVSRSVVELLLPKEWYDWLSAFRAPFWKVGRGCSADTGAYAKFSSMGNGYTFVLETLIFYAACYACGASVASVYGDDICVSSEVYTELVQLLRFLGFVPNEKKSHHTGPFRESCGVDFHSGIDIRPFYLRKNMLDDKELCVFINGMAVWAVESPQLAAYLSRFVKVRSLPLVPYNADSSLGVFVTYDASLKRQRGWITSWRVLQYRHSTLKSGVKEYWHALFRMRVASPIGEQMGRIRTSKKIRCQWMPIHIGRGRPHIEMWTRMVL